jgi:hypothetical protein
MAAAPVQPQCQEDVMPEAPPPNPYPSNPASHSEPRPHQGGIGFAMFLVLAGLALLAERLGWLSDGFDWLFPIVLISWGLSELYQRLSAR